MVQIENLPLVLTGLGLSASIFYYTLVLRNANKTQQMQLETRQAQLYTQIIKELFDEKYMKKSIHMLKMEWDDYDDFERKYGSDNNEDSYAERYSYWYFMNNIGFLLHENLINVRTANAIVSQFAMWSWDKFKDVIQMQREVYDMPDFMEWFEYLAEELTKYRTSKGLSTETPEGFGSYTPRNQ
jgi:hypothetical protein